MDTLLKADIFFFITTLAVVVLSVLFSVAMYYLIQVLRDIREIARITRREVDLWKDNLNEMREDVRERFESAKEGYDSLAENVATTKAYAQAVIGPVGLRRALRFLLDTFRESRGSRRGRRGERPAEGEE